MILSKVTGIEQIIRRLNTKKNETAQGMQRGLKKAGLFLQRKSQEIVPVDTGALKNSAFTRSTGSRFSTKVDVGYTQNYAIYVHEDLEARHRPGKQAQFLSMPAAKYRKEMVEIVRKEAKLR